MKKYLVLVCLLLIAVCSCEVDSVAEINTPTEQEVNSEVELRSPPIPLPLCRQSKALGKEIKGLELKLDSLPENAYLMRDLITEQIVEKRMEKEKVDKLRKERKRKK